VERRRPLLHAGPELAPVLETRRPQWRPGSLM
jgi:hypothetical protein